MQGGEERAFSFSASVWKNLLRAITLRRWGLLDRGKVKLHTSREPGGARAGARAGQKCFLGGSQVGGFFSPFCSRITFLLMELAAVSRCRSVAGINRLAKAE